MAIPVEMPKMSDTMEEGVLVSWQAEEGDKISAGDVIAQVETDKATMDLEVYDDGVLLKKVVKEGDAIPIGGLIAVLGDEGEDVSDVLKQYEAGAAEPEAPSEDEDPEAEASSEDEEPEAEASSEDEEPEAAEAREDERDGDRAKDRRAGAKRAEPAETGEKADRPRPSGDGAQREPVAAEARGKADGRIKSSPLARRMAEEHGIELARIKGSGPEGRIIKRDVQAALAEVDEVTPYEPESIVEEEGHETIKISQMRKTIARRLAESKFTSPHFYLTVDVDMERAVSAREQINRLAESEDGPKVSFNDLITKACALALRRHPQVNASYLEQVGEIRQYRHVHVAVAVAVGEGLVTPVIRHADRKGLARIAQETRELATRARDRKLQPEDWEGSTFTTSNLGMYGIEEFTAIINPPNSCILAIGAIRDVPVVRDGAIVPGKRMKLTLSCDHRLVDGAMGAEFLKTVQQYLEEPLSMLL